MGKYIHYFQTMEDFYNVYYTSGDTIVTSIVVDGVSYTYSGRPGEYFVWVNGENWVDSDVKRNPSAGDVAYISGETETNIESVVTATTQVHYREPWISYVPGSKIQYNYKEDSGGSGGPVIGPGEPEIN